MDDELCDLQWLKIPIDEQQPTCYFQNKYPVRLPKIAELKKMPTNITPKSSAVKKKESPSDENKLEELTSSLKIEDYSDEILSEVELPLLKVKRAVKKIIRINQFQRITSPNKQQQKKPTEKNPSSQKWRSYASATPDPQKVPLLYKRERQMSETMKPINETKRRVKIRFEYDKRVKEAAALKMRARANSRAEQKKKGERRHEGDEIKSESEKEIECEEVVIEKTKVVVDQQVELLEDYESVLPPKDDGLQLSGELISYPVAQSLRNLLFGSTKTISFNMRWRNHSIRFRKPGNYALDFYKVDDITELLAPLQGMIVKRLLFVNSKNQADITLLLQPDVSEQKNVLAMSICDILWQAGQKKHAVVALVLNMSAAFIPGADYIIDRITEKMHLFKFKDFEELQTFVRKYLHQFESSSSFGCICLLYSAILSRGLLRVQNDCKELNEGILSFNGNLQVLINLLIFGEAVPNVFNGTEETENEVTEQIDIKRGIKRRSEIGFLSHTEFSQKLYCVGSCMKTPIYPIWVTCMDNKYSVLFSLKRDLLNDWKLERRFDLYYYQGASRFISHNDYDFCLTIDTVSAFHTNDFEDEECSLLEQTIRTKWMETVVIWNGHARF